MHTRIYYAATCTCIYKVEPLHNGHFGIVSLIRMIHYIVNSYIVVAIISYHDQL